MVPTLIERAEFDPDARGRVRVRARGHDALLGRGADRARGVPRTQVYVSMERNMKCAVGHCGHCQLGPEFVCRDGPVFTFERMRARLQALREL